MKEFILSLKTELKEAGSALLRLNFLKLSVRVDDELLARVMALLLLLRVVEEPLEHAYVDLIFFPDGFRFEGD